MKKTKNHALIGIISIILGLLTAFVLTPIYSGILEKQEEVVRVKEKITEGELITADKLETVKVGSYGLSPDVIKSSDGITGKYAKTDFYKGSYITGEGLSDVAPLEDTYLNDIPDDKYAISITVQSFAAGLSSKLLKGDIVTIITKKGEGDEAITEIPRELTYVEVLSTTEEDGEDKENNGKEVKKEDDSKKKGKLATITLLVNGMQAEELASFENQRGIHVALKCRNNDKLKKELLDAQEKIFKEMEESISETDGNTTVEPGRKPSGKDKKETDGNTAVEAGRKPPGENKKETDEKNK